MPTPTALRIAAPALEPWAELAVGDADTRLRYALDPFAWFEEGLLKVPDVKSKRPVPFELYGHQREVITDYVDLALLAAWRAELEASEAASPAMALALDGRRPRFRNLHMDKSRQMGDTWVFGGIFLWAVSFWPVSGLVTHLKQKKVDDGGEKATVESFFGKVLYLWKSLPLEHRAPLDFTYLLIRNLLNGGYVLGEGANSDPGRGGSYDLVLADEAARLAYGAAAQAALVSACPEGRAYLSTPFGEDPVFHALKESRPQGMRFQTHHWSIHPVYGAGAHIAGAEPRTCERCRNTRAGVRWDATTIKSHRFPGKLTSPWYDLKNAELDAETVAQELDIDYAASLTARVYPEFSDPTHVWSPAQLLERFGRAQLFDAEQLPELAWDYGADTNAVLVLQDMPSYLGVCGEYEIGDSLPEEVAEAVKELLADLGLPLEYLEPHWTRRFFAVGDPAGESRDVGTGRPLVSDYRKAGFSIQSRREKLTTTVRAAKRIMLGRPKPLVVDGARCPLFVKHAKANRWPTDAQGRRKLNATEPLNDEHNHAMRAFAYFVCFKYPPPETVGAESDTVGQQGRERLPSARLTDTPIRPDEQF